MSSVRASLGVRVKSGVACAVLVRVSGAAPQVVCRHTLDLCDPAVPASRQPYHALMQARVADAAELESRLRAVVGEATRRSVKQLLDSVQEPELRVFATGLVVGSTIDPARIANEHIRAHASEGQLFRTTLANCFAARGLPCSVFVERNIYEQASDALGKSSAEIKRLLAALGRGSSGPWRADEKLATLAAWLTTFPSRNVVAAPNGSPRE